MLLDKKSVIKKVRKYSDLVNTVIKPNKIILYGSFAKGNWNENSDIDVAIIVDKIEGDYLLLMKKLNKLTRDIDYRIEPVLLEPKDDISGFLTSVLLTGLVIYNRDQKQIVHNTIPNVTV